MAATTATDAANTPSSGETTPAATTPAGETTKPAETKPAATTTTPPETPGAKPASTADQAPPASKAPATYALTLPDGGRIDAHDLATIEAVAREQGWTNAEAQARVNAHADAIEAQVTQFRTLTEADPVYGGAHLAETQKHAAAALDKLRPKGTPRGDAFRGLLEKSGYGNHLEVVSFLADLGKQYVEDGSYGGRNDVGESQDTASLLYPTMAK